MNRYNVWSKWGKLNTMVLGSMYYPDYFREVKNNRIRSALQQIAEESIADLENYERVLKSFGCNVLRPYLDPKASIMDDTQDGKLIRVPRPPLQPRDPFMVLGNKMYYGVDDHPAMYDCIKQYNPDIIDLEGMGCDAPYFTLVGKDLYVDVRPNREYLRVTDKHVDIVKATNLDLRVNKLSIGGHSDGTFHTLKPGAILSLAEIQNYEKTFPGWDVCYLPNQSWELVDDFYKMKDIVRGRWWVPGQEENKEFIYFVETWLEDWVGYCEESVFDVNVVMLDERNVLCVNYNKEAFDFFKKHKIEPTIVPWRHRWFFDGGLHCVTLDLDRDGEMVDYFPDRKEPIVDPGY